MSGAEAAELPVYRASIQPEWIDYNGHLRDAYYLLVASYAIDELMDYLGLDAAYRAATHCTLYSLEMHVHFLNEVKATDDLKVITSILDFDRKRIHAGCTLRLQPACRSGRLGGYDADARPPGSQAGRRDLSGRRHRKIERPQIVHCGTRRIWSALAADRIEAALRAWRRWTFVA